MQLKDIETAIRKNFVMDKGGNHFLGTDRFIECSKETAIIVFIALSRLNGYKSNEIFQYLCISKKKYFVLLNEYFRARNQYWDVPVSMLYIDLNVHKKIISKIKLISNSLNMKLGAKEFIGVEELGY